MTILRYITVFFACFLAFCSFTKADSPLTSTPFSDAYMDVERVRVAKEHENVLTKELAIYLNNEEIPIVYRLAAINAIGWDIDGTNNYQVFLDYLILTVATINEVNFQEVCTADQLICLAYLKALDDYFDVEDALKLATLAIEKAPSTYSIHLIHGLIKAQKALDTDWCEVYKATNSVRNNEVLEIDMNEEAIQIIFGYMDIYEEDC